jgi:hypothetical protein
LAESQSGRTINIICTLGAKGVLYVRSSTTSAPITKRLRDLDGCFFINFIVGGCLGEAIDGGSDVRLDR